MIRGFWFEVLNYIQLFFTSAVDAKTVVRFQLLVIVTIRYNTISLSKPTHEVVCHIDNPFFHFRTRALSVIILQHSNMKNQQILTEFTCRLTYGSDP